MPGDVSGGRGPVRNKPLRLVSGRILAGASTEHGIWKAFADISDDDGVSWHKSSAVQIDGLQYQAGEKTADSNIAVSQRQLQIIPLRAHQHHQLLKKAVK